jgi:hypothetical protein
MGIKAKLTTSHPPLYGFVIVREKSLKNMNEEIIYKFSSGFLIKTIEKIKNRNTKIPVFGYKMTEINDKKMGINTKK